MKKIDKLKLTQLNKAELEKRQMNLLKGGKYCFCVGCLCMDSYEDDYAAYYVGEVSESIVGYDLTNDNLNAA
jgi:natural product precursor